MYVYVWFVPVCVCVLADCFPLHSYSRTHFCQIGEIFLYLASSDTSSSALAFCIGYLTLAVFLASYVVLEPSMIETRQFLRFFLLFLKVCRVCVCWSAGVASGE